MNYAIKTLQNQATLIKDLCEQTELKISEDHEFSSDYEFLYNDLRNFTTQISELNNAISALKKLEIKETMDKFENWYVEKVLKQKE